jgi:DNA-binding SARP family transcriptional activator/TolB-like protein
MMAVLMVASGVNSVEIRVLGPIAVVRGGAPVALPRSRKVRALLAYLALSPHPVSRTRLCDLLWDVPNDPRGELRWCLSKLRGLLDEAGHARVVTAGDLVSLELSDARVDALDIERAAKSGFDGIAQAELGLLCDRFSGDLLDGVDIDGNAELTGWLAAQRNRYRTLHIDLLRALIARAGPEETFRRLEAWLQVAPFDPQAHEIMLEALARAGRLRDGDEHLARTIRAFEAEGIEWTALRDRWQAIRTRTPRVEVAPAPAPVEAVRPRRRAAVAVTPFVARAEGATRVADGITEDIIMQLARLRVLFVIARGSVFALAERGVQPHEAARVLEVDYYVTGSLRRDAGQVTLAVELVDARDGTIVWTDAFVSAGDETFSMLDQITTRVVASIAEAIETAETRRAVLKPPSSLDAWEAYHRGLWHMYKFTGPDNRHAEQFFRNALDLDPTFARAHAGLSFTHFQNAFLDLTSDRARQIELAFEAANHSLAADDHDPAAHWAMGRALWLRGDHAESLTELERSIELSPNFALGHYTLGFVHSQKGDPQAAIDATNYSRQLSPFDPLQFAMLASRAIAHIRLEQMSEAADWAVKATARPNAHAHILAIAASSLALAQRTDEARRFVGRIRDRLPAYTIEDFLRAFHFDSDIERLFRAGARQIGFTGREP